MDPSSINFMIQGGALGIIFLMIIAAWKGIPVILDKAKDCLVVIREIMAEQNQSHAERMTAQLEAHAAETEGLRVLAEKMAAGKQHCHFTPDDEKSSGDRK